MEPSQVTAVILTRDEERNLPRAMTSLPHGMNALVLDAQSEDGTVSYARRAGARVIDRAWTDFVDARRFALAQVTTPWVLMLDADEALDDVLRDAIIAAPETAIGYIVRRTTYFHGKPLRMWSHEPLLRLVRCDAARIEARPAAGGEAALHERLVCDGTQVELRGELLHYSYPDYESYRRKYRTYTSLEAAGSRRSVAHALLFSLLAPARYAWNLIRRG
ncbi:MAG TPA: glycosyltransferase family 2 protein, partial [Candidatus Baltobacteraceae bacterium]|nr:glycosyltransferase family 2 protein [Candidatus Baltobacteraceae bacterium]